MQLIFTYIRIFHKNALKILNDARRPLAQAVYVCSLL